MREKIIKNTIAIIVILVIAIVIAIQADSFYESTPAEVEKATTGSNLTEDQKRWDRGEFTQEEINEIKQEEAREDIEKEKFFKDLNSGHKID